MKLDKFLWSKTKSDILKYLIFRRQGVSMRAMSNDIAWTFPAIKKQVDSLEASEIIVIERENNQFYIMLNPEIADVIKELYIVGIKMDIIKYLEEYSFIIDQFYFGRLFGTSSDIDLVVVYTSTIPLIDPIKQQINEILRSYFIETASIVFMHSDERNKRYRLADKFVLTIIRNTIKWPLLTMKKIKIRSSLAIQEDIEKAIIKKNKINLAISELWKEKTNKSKTMLIKTDSQTILTPKQQQLL